MIKIKEILRSRKLVFPEKGIKIDKREDGLIEIRDMTGKKYAILKRLSCVSGRLYLGFDRYKPFGIFFLYNYNDENVKEAKKELKDFFPFLRFKFKRKKSFKKEYIVDVEIADLFYFMQYFSDVDIEKIREELRE